MIISDRNEEMNNNQGPRVQRMEMSIVDFSQVCTLAHVINPRVPLQLPILVSSPLGQETVSTNSTGFFLLSCDGGCSWWSNCGTQC